MSENDVTVYAYKMKHQERWAGGLSDPWFILTADTQDELHEFAARLGLPRQEPQPGQPGWAAAGAGFLADYRDRWRA